MAERVKIAVELGGGYNAVLQKSEISTTSLNRYLKGYDMKSGTARKIAEACGVSAQWLLFGEGERSVTPGSASASAADDILIPCFDILLSAGPGNEAIEDHAPQRLSIPRHLLSEEVIRKQKTLIAVTVRGESMEPLISDGDRVLLDTVQEPIRDGFIYAIRIVDQLKIKKLKTKTNGNIVLISQNPEFEPEEIDATQARELWTNSSSSNPMHLMGRVVWRCGKI